MRIALSRPLAIAIAGLLVLAPGGVWAQIPDASAKPPPVAPEASPVAEKLALADDGRSRMTIPVMIDGQGPFAFIIDTGADRTVISQELAETLKLPSGPEVLMHESAGVDEMQTVVIDALGVGKRVVEHINAPVIPAATLGAAGLLGIDSLRDQNIIMNFKTQQLLTSPSRTEVFDPNAIIVRGRSRFGQLVLVDAVVRGVPIYVILDSGAQNTVGNLALQRILVSRDRQNDPMQAVQVVSVTGRTTPAEWKEITEMHVGGLTISNVPLAFADLHTFARFGLKDRPAMLLGMDVLGLCQKVSVDFKRRQATFILNRD